MFLHTQNIQNATTTFLSHPLSVLISKYMEKARSHFFFLLFSTPFSHFQLFMYFIYMFFRPFYIRKCFFHIKRKAKLFQDYINKQSVKVYVVETLYIKFFLYILLTFTFILRFFEKVKRNIQSSDFISISFFTSPAGK